MYYLITPKIRLFFLFVIVLLSIDNVNATANVDSLRQIWTDDAQSDSTRFDAINKYYKYKLYAQPDSVILLSAYHTELAIEKHSKKEMGIASNKKGIAYSFKGDYNNALIEITKSVDIYSSLKDSMALMNGYNNLAMLYKERIEYQKALTYFSKCLDFYTANKIIAAQASTLMNIGLVYLDISNYDLALDNFNRSLHIFERLGIADKIGVIWLNIAEVNFGKKKYQQAIKNVQKALKIHKPLNQDYYTASGYMINAKIYQATNNIDTALVYIKKGLNLHKKMGANQLILEDEILLANLISTTDTKKAIQIGEEVLKTADAYDNHTMKIDLYDLLYKSYKKERNYPRSIVMLKKYNNHSDSLRIEQNKIAVIKKTIQDEYESKIANTQLENEQSKSNLKLNQFQKTSASLFIGGLIILCSLLYARANRKILDKEKEGLVHKVSYLKELEHTHNQLIQSNKMASLGQLTAGVAHEVNNPVNFISSGVIGVRKTLAEFIKTPKDEVSDELVKDMNNMISAIEEGAKRTSNIVKSLHLFSREDTENYVTADVIQGLESTFTLLSNKLVGGVFLEKHFESIELPIYCFPGQLNQVFMNILLNAIQAVEGAGIVKVEIKEEAQNVIITISDNGAGIPVDKKQKIFEPFYTTKSIQEGTGLGLSISCEIIKKHNGSIEVKDNDPNGTQFIIRLPKKDDDLIAGEEHFTTLGHIDT